MSTPVQEDESTLPITSLGHAPRTLAEATRVRIAAFLRNAKFWSVSTIARDGAPQGAVVGVAVAEDLALVFDTLGTTRKADNLRRDPRVSLVMWHDGATAQIEGTAAEPAGDALTDVKRVYFATFPDGPEREGWPDITYVRVVPSWIRISDFGGEGPTVVELDAAALDARR